MTLAPSNAVIAIAIYDPISLGCPENPLEPYRVRTGDVLFTHTNMHRADARKRMRNGSSREFPVVTNAKPTKGSQLEFVGIAIQDVSQWPAKISVAVTGAVSIRVNTTVVSTIKPGDLLTINYANPQSEPDTHYFKLETHTDVPFYYKLLEAHQGTAITLETLEALSVPSETLRKSLANNASQALDCIRTAVSTVFPDSSGLIEGEFYGPGVGDDIRLEDFIPSKYLYQRIKFNDQDAWNFTRDNGAVPLAVRFGALVAAAMTKNPTLNTSDGARAAIKGGTAEDFFDLGNPGLGTSRAVDVLNTIMGSAIDKRRAVFCAQGLVANDDTARELGHKALAAAFIAFQSNQSDVESIMPQIVGALQVGVEVPPCSRGTPFARVLETGDSEYVRSLVINYPL